MKTKITLTLFTVLAFSFAVFAQGGITNEGAVIVIESGTTVSITNSGGYFNKTSGGNDGSIDLDGIITVDGDFSNTAANNVFINSNSDGEVIFTKDGVQNITSSLADMSNFIDFEKVTINANNSSNVILAAGSAMTTNGDFKVDGVFTSETPASDAASGSLITNANVIGAGTINLKRYFAVNNRWQYISVPMADQSSDLLINIYGGDVNPNFYEYDETFIGDDPTDTEYANWNDFYGMWVNVGAGVTLDVGKGYTWNATTQPDVTATFTGVATKLNSGDTYVTVTYTDNDNGGNNGLYYDGWNLVGNPFPSALDWDSLGRTPSMDATVYFWDGDAGNYIYHFDSSDDHLIGTNQTLNDLDAQKNIPAYQSFMVHLDGSQTDEAFKLENNARVHSSHVMYKSKETKETKETPNFEFLRLKVENDGKSDETIVRFIDGTINDFNGKEDALKMFPWDKSIPMIYSVTTETQEFPLAINSLPISSIGTTIPLGLRTDNAGTFTIQCNEFNFNAGSEVILIDTKENTETALYEGAEYTFSYKGDDSRDRFYLFTKNSTTDIEEPIIENLETSTKVWSSANTIYISISSYQLIDANVEVYDMLGKIVTAKKLNGTYNTIDINNATGTYFVKLRTKDGKVTTNKVFIKK